MRRRWILEGRVQGVGFRMWVKRQAHALDLTGWVRNLEGGGVEVEAEGEAEAMADFEKRIRRGPPHALVSSCTTPDPNTDVLPSAFEIRRDVRG